VRFSFTGSAPKIDMRYRPPIVVTLLSLAVACVVFGPAAKSQDQTAQSDAPPTDQQVRALEMRVLENQHHNDLLLEQYDRTEHDLLRGKGVTNKETIARVVPTGTGEARVELQRDGMATDPALQAQQWRAVTQALLNNSRTDDPEVKKEYEKAEKRDHERAEIIDSVGKAFRFHYVDREVVGGRKLLVLSFDPDPGFHSSLRYASICAHIHGKAWVDESSAQVVRVQAELFDDYSLAAGLLAKVYRGSSVTLEQTEVEPGVWMPAHTSYEVAGRKFLFSLVMHEQIEDNDYRRVGPPREALQAIGSEHSEQSLENVKVQR
jgi:hypothetical protein